MLVTVPQFIRPALDLGKVEGILQEFRRDDMPFRRARVPGRPACGFLGTCPKVRQQLDMVVRSPFATLARLTWEDAMTEGPCQRSMPTDQMAEELPRQSEEHAWTVGLSFVFYSGASFLVVTRT